MPRTARREEATDEIMKETIIRRNQRIVDYNISTEATTERVDQASAEQEKQPEMPENLPVDSEDDIPDSDTDNTSDNMGVDEPPEAGSMRGEAQTHKVNAPGETSVGRQRELAAGPSDNSAQKRQRIQLLEDLEKSVKNIMSATFAHGESAVSDLCNRETLKKIIGDLDESWTAQISRKFKRFAERCDKRAEKLTKTKSRRERDPDVAEIFSH